LTIVPPEEATSAISVDDHRTAPAVIDALLPLAAALVALLFAGKLGHSALRRPAGQKVLWGIGFLLFAFAAATEAVAHRAGWTTPLFRTYYLAGGVLTVAYLGAGSAWMLLRPRLRDAMI